MLLCCVPNCVNHKEETSVNEGISFHPFPAEQLSRESWINSISSGVNSDGSPWIAPIDIERARLCSLHFKPEDFCKGPFRHKRPLLKPSSIPSLFPTGNIQMELPTVKKRALTAEGDDDETKKQKRDEQTSEAILNAVKTVLSATPCVAEGENATLEVSTNQEDPNSNAISANNKHVVFTDKSGKKFLLLTAPMTSESAKKVSKVFTAKPKTPTTTKTVAKAASEGVKVTKKVTNILPKNTPIVASPATTVKPQPVTHDFSEAMKRLEDRKTEAAEKEKAKISAHLDFCATVTMYKEIQSLKKELRKKNSQLNQFKTMVDKLKNDKDTGHLDGQLVKSIKALQEKAEGGDHAATFVIDQIRHLDKKAQNYSDSTMQYCAMWNSYSAESYEFIRQTKLLCLPSKITIKKFIGQPVTASNNVNSNSELQKRLQTKVSKLTESQKVGSLVIRDMCTKQSETPDASQPPSSVEGENQDSDESVKLPGHFVSFLFVGLNLPGSIPVAYHFVKQSDSEQLKNLTIPLVEDMEKAGFKIVRIVADCTINNVIMFALMGDGEVKPEIRHTLAPQRPLFLTCDYVDVIKQVRWQFIESQNLENMGSPISRLFVRRLYNIKPQDVPLISSFNLPNRKQMFSKESSGAAKLSFALRIFSPKMSASLRVMVETTSRADFSNSERTIEFMEMMYRWAIIQDICNSAPQLSPDGLSDDEKFFHAGIIDWLESDFLNYLEQWRCSCSNSDTQFLSSINYEGLRLTTAASILYVRYLLESKFRLSAATNFELNEVASIVDEILLKKKENSILVNADGDPISEVPIDEGVPMIEEHEDTVVDQTVSIEETQQHEQQQVQEQQQEEQEQLQLQQGEEVVQNVVGTSQLTNNMESNVAILESILERDAAIAVLEALSTGGFDQEQCITVYL